MDQIKNLENKEILNFKEFCDYTGLSSSSAYKLTHGKKIPYYKPAGGKLYFKLKEVKEFLLHNRIASNDEIERRAAKHSLA